MRTDPILNAVTELPLYHEALQSDHDYRVWVDILTLEEVFVSSVDVLDGQVNVNHDADGPVRTGSLVLADPEGALQFGIGYARDDKDVLWVNRLLRVNHSITIPTLGTVRAIVGVGVPTAVSRSGGEIGLEWGDKSVLADHGVKPGQYRRGANVHDVLVRVLRDQTGERHFRIPLTPKKTITKKGGFSYGMGEDDLTPWQLFKKVAATQAPNGGWRAYYSNDGFATCEPFSDKGTTMKVDDVLSLPDSSSTFSEFVNYVKVTSVRKTVDKKGTPKETKDDVNVKTTRIGIAELSAKHDLSAQSLKRNGVPRLLPLVVVDNDLKTATAVKARAKLEMRQVENSSGIDTDQSYETIPFFHLDVGDKLDLPAGIGEIKFWTVSIPLGVNGNMSIGAVKWVSRPVVVRKVRYSQHAKRRKANKGKGKGGKD